MKQTYKIQVFPTEDNYNENYYKKLKRILNKYDINKKAYIETEPNVTIFEVDNFNFFPKLLEEIKEKVDEEAEKLIFSKINDYEYEIEIYNALRENFAKFDNAYI